MSSFWLILKQQWTIEEISIFSNSSHLEWRADLSDTILKGTHPGTIPARLGLIWFSGFRGEDLNVKVYDGRRMPSDGKSSQKSNLNVNKISDYSVPARSFSQGGPSALFQMTLCALFMTPCVFFMTPCPFSKSICLF